MNINWEECPKKMQFISILKLPWNKLQWIICSKEENYLITVLFSTWLTEYRTLSSSMGSHQCGSFHGSSNEQLDWTSSHKLGILMVYHKWGFSHESSNIQPHWTSSHKLGSLMVYHKCGFSHKSSNCLPVWMSCHTLINWMVSYQWGLFNESSNARTN